MALKDQFQEDLDNVFYDSDDFVEDLVYETVTVQAHIKRLGSLDISSSGAATYANIRLRKSQVANPKFGDAVEFDSKNWTVEKTLSSNNLESKLLVKTEESYSFGV